MEQSNPTKMNEAQPTKFIFILCGESNMAGRGGVDMHSHWDGVVPPQCAPDPTKIYRLNADLKWEVATEPLHRDIDNKKTCGVGPGMAFANAIKYLVGEIGLVPCAVGGTAIKDWGRGTHLYENMVKRARAATATATAISTPTPTPSNYTASPTATSTATSTLTGTTTAKFAAILTATTTASSTVNPTPTVNPIPTVNPSPAVTATAGGGEIKALLWYQGESDGMSDHDANCNKEKMEELIANIRADLNLPCLPIIQVAIGSGDVKFTEKVRKAQLEMKVDSVVWVDVKGLPLKEDNLHLTSEAQVQLGHMLAKAYVKHFAC